MYDLIEMHFIIWNGNRQKTETKLNNNRSVANDIKGYTMTIEHQN